MYIIYETRTEPVKSIHEAMRAHPEKPAPAGKERKNGRKTAHSQKVFKPYLRLPVNEHENKSPA